MAIMDNKVDKFYPVQGVNKFETVSFPMTRAFNIDFGAQGSSGTAVTESFPKGCVILGFAARVTEAYESGGSGTFQLGFTGKQMLTSALSSGDAGLAVILTPSSTAATIPYCLTADDTFDVIIGTSGGATAGKVDVFVTYIPIPVNNLSTNEFREWVTSS